jgi:hypothetical protein
VCGQPSGRSFLPVPTLTIQRQRQNPSTRSANRLGLALIAFTSADAVAWYMLVVALNPLGDSLIVRRHGGTKASPPIRRNWRRRTAGPNDRFHLTSSEPMHMQREGSITARHHRATEPGETPVDRPIP